MYNPQLDTFFIVSETGSFTKASRQLYITPSAVLQQINNLEASLKVKLFVRTNQGLELTPAGEYLKSEMDGIRLRNQMLRDRLQALSDTGCRVIQVGLPKLHKSRYFYEFWTNYTLDHPGHALKFVEAGSTSVTEIHNVFSGVDLIEYPDFGFDWQKHMHFIPITECPVGFNLPSRHPLASRSCVSPADLRGQHIIVHDSPIKEHMMPFLRILEDSGAELEYVPTYSMAVFADAVVSNKMVLIPACSYNIHDGLVHLRCCWEPALPYGIFYSDSMEGNPLIEYIRNEVRSGHFEKIW